MRTASNSFYYIVFGALLIILAIALFSTVPAWREILLGPQPQRELAQSSQPTGQLGSAGSRREEADAAPAAEAEAVQAKSEAPPMAAPGLPRESGQQPDSGRPAGLFEQGKTYRFGGDEEMRPIFVAPRPSYDGPLTLVDSIVYDRPDGDPLPAPSLTNTALILLRGTRVGALERSGKWLRVLTPSGQRGWVLAREVANLPGHLAGSGGKAD